MNIFFWLLLFAAILLAGVYFLAPQLLVALTVWLVRKWGRLTAKSIVVDGVNWPYLEGGPPEGDTVVMVHGFAGDKDNWSLYAHFFTRRFRVIAPDLPGFGQNVRNADWDYRGAAQTERLRAFLERMRIDKFHLTGNSMGGYIALNYALHYPERVKTLTLIDNAGVTSRNKSELELAIDEGRNPLVAKTLDEFDGLLNFVMQKRIPSPAFMMRAMFAVQRRHYELLDRIFWAFADEALQHNLTERLGDVVMPTLIIWGRHDRLIDVSCAEAMAAAIPDNRLVILEDVGHVPMIESPAEAARHQISLIDACRS
jgi:pimeloyl-ACP methyl ester carboxylesterase